MSTHLLTSAFVIGLHLSLAKFAQVDFYLCGHLCKILLQIIVLLINLSNLLFHFLFHSYASSAREMFEVVFGAVSKKQFFIEVQLIVQGGF